MSIKKRGLITLALAGSLVPILPFLFPVFASSYYKIASVFEVSGQIIIYSICSVILSFFFNMQNEIRKKSFVIRIVYFAVTLLICLITSVIVFFIMFILMIVFGFYRG